MLNRRKVYLSKVEADKGVDAMPTPADDLILPNGELQIGVPTEQDTGEGDIKGTFGPGDSVTIKQAQNLPVTTRVRGLGQAAAALIVPSVHPWLISSGHTVVSTGDGIATPRESTYTPSSVEANLKTTTDYFYEDGLLYALLACAGDLAFEATMAALMARSTRQATFAPPTVQALPAWAAPAEEVFRMTSALMTITEAGLAINIGAFTFDTGTAVEENNEVGNHSFEVANRLPTISIDPKAVPDPADWNALTNATAAAIVATFTNGIGETLVFNYPRAVPREITSGARGGRITRAKVFSLKETAGDDQYTIKWTSVL